MSLVPVDLKVQLELLSQQRQLYANTIFIEGHRYAGFDCIPQEERSQGVNDQMALIKKNLTECSILLQYYDRQVSKVEADIAALKAAKPEDEPLT